MNKILNYLQCSKEMFLKTLFSLTLSVMVSNVNATTDAWARPYEIKFNYEGASSTNDANTIRKSDGTAATIPEWKYSTRNDKFAYIKSQSNRKIQVSIDSNCDDMHLLINLNVTSGNGLGEVCNYFVANYHKKDWITLDLDGTIPGTVDIRTFTWEWEIYILPDDISTYCAASTTTNTTHTYYTLLDTPTAPMAEPCENILNDACDWASGEDDAEGVSVGILSNGFNSHYTWNMDCHRLSSDFVYLVTSLGIEATLHRWASQNYYVGDMAYQRTKSIDPVGTRWDQGIIEWSWHQWAEAVSSQRDPSANASMSGSWGAYEDDLFSHYQVLTSNYPYYYWTSNQTGQYIGCEASGHRLKYSYPSDNILYDWRGPDR